MKNLLLSLVVALLCSASAEAKVEVREGKFYFNDERQDMVWGRSCFKLANQVTYHYTGQGGGAYGLGSARQWVDFNLQLASPGFVCRVFLETAGWETCDDNGNGVPENCMFGSEPIDRGFWRRNELRDGHRETEVHAVGRKVIEWFYKTSQETGMAFELVIDATLKHDDIPKGEIDHVMRQVGVYMGEVMEVQYPQALIIPNLRNEWNAHNQSGHTLAEINMWAVRWDRDNYYPHGGAAKIIDGGGANSFDYDVGPEDGKYRAGLVHPERDEGWEFFPSSSQRHQLCDIDSRGMPCGANESMYYVEPEDRSRAEQWYRPGGWSSDWTKYEVFLNHQLTAGLDYFIIHDEKGAQSQPNWPRPMTRVDGWIHDSLGDGGPVVPPTAGPYDHVITAAYELVLQRPADPGGLAGYNQWLGECLSATLGLPTCYGQLYDVLLTSNEYKDKFIH